MRQNGKKSVNTGEETKAYQVDLIGYRSKYISEYRTRKDQFLFHNFFYVF